MNKHQLRKIYLKKRSALTSLEIEEKSLAIANNIITLDIWNYRNYHLFLPIKRHHEVNTEHILHLLMGKDKNIIISKSDFNDYSMTHHLLTDQTVLKTNRFGIPEPASDDIRVTESDIDVVFTPLLAFDKNGHRIGYGKGFYDRFFRECRSNTIKIGVSFFEAIEHEIPNESNDFALDIVVTPSKSYFF